MMETNEIEVGEDLQITKVERRKQFHGTWVHGSLNGHRFQALVFPEHAENPEYEIGDSKISKLWIQRIADKATVFNWDRGADVPAADATVESIVGFLAAGLADHVYAE
jgi:hypothetical protein